MNQFVEYEKCNAIIPLSAHVAPGHRARRLSRRFVGGKPRLDVHTKFIGQGVQT